MQRTFSQTTESAAQSVWTICPTSQPVSDDCQGSMQFHRSISGPVRSIALGTCVNSGAMRVTHDWCGGAEARSLDRYHRS